MKLGKSKSPIASGYNSTNSSKYLVTMFGCAVLFASPAVFAAPGDVDPTFGIVLRAASQFYSEGHASALQRDGKILLGGDTGTGSTSGPVQDMVLIRHNMNATSDSTFGGGSGQVITHVGSFATGSQDTINGLVVLPDGTIEAAGWDIDSSGTHSDVALVRYQANGSLDLTFGTSGSVSAAFGTGNATSNAVALQRDLKLVVVGHVQSGQKPQLLVARFSNSGALDTSFGTGGSFVLPTSISSSSDGTSVAVQPDGKIVVGGCVDAGNTGGCGTTAIVRLTANGALDTTFGTGGHVFSPLPQFVGASMVIQPDGKIDVNATFETVTRYNANGSLDTTFNGTGTSELSGLGGGVVALLPTGQILISTANYDQNTALSSFKVARFTAQGKLDTSFRDSGGQSGLIFTSLTTGHTSLAPLPGVESIVVGPDGKFTVSGNAPDSSNGYLAMVRYTGDPLDLTPNPATFTNVTGVPVSTVQVSNTITISGLTAGAWVPVTVSGGTYSINGGPWTTAMGYVRNGDLIMVERTSAATSGVTLKTQLYIGGMYAPNNNASVLGTGITASFSSTTK